LTEPGVVNAALKHATNPSPSPKNLNDIFSHKTSVKTPALTSLGKTHAGSAKSLVSKDSADASAAAVAKMPADAYADAKLEVCASKVSPVAKDGHDGSASDHVVAGSSAFDGESKVSADAKAATIAGNAIVGDDLATSANSALKPPRPGTNPRHPVDLTAASKAIGTTDSRSETLPSVKPTFVDPGARLSSSTIGAPPQLGSPADANPPSVATSASTQHLCLVDLNRDSQSTGNWQIIEDTQFYCWPTGPSAALFLLQSIHGTGRECVRSRHECQGHSHRVGGSVIERKVGQQNMESQIEGDDHWSSGWT